MPMIGARADGEDDILQLRTVIERDNTGSIIS